MTLLSTINLLRTFVHTKRTALPQPNTRNLRWRLAEVTANMWDLGFTAFGGPPVHFQILHRRFVDGEGHFGAKWIDEQTVSVLEANFLLHVSDKGHIVSRALRNLSGASGPSFYQNGVLYRDDPRRPYRSYLCLLTLELTWRDWDVRSFTRGAEDA